MACVFLVHWNESEWRDLAAPLRAAGHDVQGHFAADRAPSWQGFEPAVAVISLERLPAHGREIADWVWSAKKRRHVPVVFVGGKSEKVAETKTRFPEATYCTLDDLTRVVDAIASGRRTTAPAPVHRVKTAETAKRPSATPLVKKLGIHAETSFLLVNAPKGFLEVLQPPAGASQTKGVATADVVLTFVQSAKELAARLAAARRDMKPDAAIWVAWPKRTSGIASDLTDEVVRQMGLRARLVDVKVCAIDDVWSGLKFVVPVADRPRRSAQKPRKK